MDAAFAEKRRSDRLWLTIPLRVGGFDSNGQLFEYEGRTISLNRYGARIQTPRLLDKGQAVQLRSPIRAYGAEFRVVDPIVSHGGKHSEYGVECLNQEENFWGIEFPPTGQNEAADTKVLLECGTCRTIALLPLARAEVEALWTMGRIGKPCLTCAGVCPWKYAEVRVSLKRAEEAPQSSMAKGWAEKRSQGISIDMKPLERGNQRICVQMPLGVRNSRGTTEMTRTENISKCGVCFVSQNIYLLGEIVITIFPFDPTSRETDVPARIVRAQPIERSDSTIYGASFDIWTPSPPLLS